MQGRQHRSTFQHLHAMFWPTRETYRTRLARPTDEAFYEQRPIISSVSPVQRSTSLREKKPWKETIFQDRQSFGRPGLCRENRTVSDDVCHQSPDAFSFFLQCRWLIFISSSLVFFSLCFSSSCSKDRCMCDTLWHVSLVERKQIKSVRR